MIWLYPDVVMTRVSSHRDGSIRSCDAQNCRDDHLRKIVTMMTVRIYRLYVLKNDFMIESIEICPLFSKENNILLSLFGKLSIENYKTALVISCFQRLTCVL